MMRSQPLALPPGLWLAGAAAGIAAGAAALAPASYLAVGLAATAVVVAFVRTQDRSETLVAAYWLAYVGLSTLFRGQAVDGFFYPFYAAFVVSALVGLVRGGLRVDTRTVWLYAVMVFLLIASLIGYQGSVNPSGLKMLTLYVFGALVMLQVRSARGSRPIAVAATIASLIVSAWVIGNAIQGGFSYRGDTRVDQNVLSFFIGVGFLVILSVWLHRPRGRANRLLMVGLLLALATMLYAMLLLASRGLLLAVAVAIVAMVVREILHDRRRLAATLVLAVLLPLGLLLPGGTGVLQRFDDPRTATAGGRTLIWSVVGSEIVASGPVQLLFGHGFGASSELVEDHFTQLVATHNAYLQVGYDLGVVGLLVFLALHLRVWLRAWRTPGQAGALVMATTTFLLATNLGINAPDNFLYWAIMGWFLAKVQWLGHDDALERTRA